MYSVAETAIFVYLVCDWENMQRNMQSLVRTQRSL
jgi:hypothetical protein